jgi:hypothetical protein
MLRAVTYAIELAVGLACAVGAAATLRRGSRMLGVVLALAGAAAMVHAIVALGGGST